MEYIFDLTLEMIGERADASSWLRLTFDYVFSKSKVS